MTMNEKKLGRVEKELNKLYKSLERYQGLFEKKQKKCIELDCNWSDEEWCEHRDANEVTKQQHEAYFDMTLYEQYIEDTKHRIGTLEKTQSKYEKLVKEENAKNEAFKAEYDRLSEMEKQLNANKYEEYEAWLAKFKADCLKDGIVIESANSAFVYGTTPNGKRFTIYANNGYTERSYHCYSVRIEANTIFTSGEFWRAYQVVKKS